MKRTKTSSKSNSKKVQKQVGQVFLQKTIQDNFGNKNTIILKWGDEKEPFLKQEIKYSVN